MSYNGSSRSPWQDRWNEPTLDQLLHCLKPQHQKLFGMILDAVGQFERVTQNIIWYGPAWKWTVQLSITDHRGKPTENLLYLVPNKDMPLVCVPLSDGAINALPLKRLKKYIRDGIAGGKFAVAIHWATWTVNSQAEVACLLDLIKRKHKFYTTPPAVEAKAG